MFIFFVFVVFVSGFGWYSYETTKDQGRPKVLKELHDAPVSNDDNGITIYPLVNNERTEDFYEYCKTNEPANPLGAVLVNSRIHSKSPPCCSKANNEAALRAFASRVFTVCST